MPPTISVLHVDDDPSILEVTAEFLQREHDWIEVTTETRVSDALERIEADPDAIDCIVSDYEMPNQDGLDFLAAVRQLAEKLPFILFTGKGNEAIASEAISAGVTDYLQKGTGTDQYTVLANRIENAVSRYRTEEELAATRRQFRKLVEQNFVGIYIIQNWEFVYVNPKLAEIHGYDRDELIGRSPLDLVAPAERERVRTNLQRRLTGEIEEIQYQTTGLRADGDQIDIELHGSRIQYNGDTAVIGAELDVTDRREGDSDHE